MKQTYANLIQFKDHEQSQYLWIGGCMLDTGEE
jgi:hypothetical protein